MTNLSCEMFSNEFVQKEVCDFQIFPKEKITKVNAN